jgi:Na+-transporting methylmalonyl-CoA/oxaloacetate decarboxylase gamma subunit
MWVGATLTIYGMGLVFLLLALLWGGIALMVRLDKEPADDAPAGGDAAEAGAEQTAEAEVAAAPEAAAVVEGDATGLSAEVLAAIVIACRAHRMARRKQAAPEMRTHQPGSQPSGWVGTGRTRQNRSWAPGGRFA